MGLPDLAHSATKLRATHTSFLYKMLSLERFGIVIGKGVISTLSVFTVLTMNKPKKEGITIISKQRMLTQGHKK